VGEPCAQVLGLLTIFVFSGTIFRLYYWRPTFAQWQKCGAAPSLVFAWKSQPSRMLPLLRTPRRLLARA
jgi:hypothetical protein